MLTRYGRALGICFQLVDDLLDFTARESELGKPVLSDLKEGKLTLPLILLLPRVEPSRRQLVEWVLEDRSFSRVSPQEILGLVKSEGTLEEVTAMAEEYAAAIRTGRAPLTDGRSGLRVLEILEAASRSLAEGGASIPLESAVTPNAMAGSARCEVAG